MSLEGLRDACAPREPRYDEVYRYAQRVIEYLDITEPPVPTDLVLNYHGLDVKEISYDDFPDIASEVNGEQMPFSALRWDKKRIYINKQLNAYQKRTSILYECGHFHIPWHHGFNYLCSEGPFSHLIRKHFDKEAYEYTYELLIPRKFLFHDFDSDISYSKIEQIKIKYESQFEMSADRFCSLNPLKCCFVIVDIMDFDSSIKSISSHDFPIKIRHSAHSKDFPCMFIPGHHFKNGSQAYRYCLDSLIYNCNFQQNFILKDYYSSERIEAMAEFKPAYNRSSVYMLIWIPESE